MRFYIMTDMEGVSGIVDFETYISPSSVYYEKGRKLATLEVNAAIDGILSTGVHQIVVCDGHGYGAIDIELLHKEASLIMGRPLDLMFEMGDGYFDAFLMVGQHAMQNASGANLSHTFDHINIESLTINNIPMGEAGVNALRAGLFGVPTIFLSGDTAACEEIQKIIHEVHTCSVKRGITRTSAICLQPENAREKIRRSVIDAVRNMENIRPFIIPPPYEAIFEYNNAASLNKYMDKPYAKIQSHNKVSIYADDLQTLLSKNLWGL